MRVGKLYIKIFLYFVATILLAELLVFGLYKLIPLEKRFSRFEKLAVAHIDFVKESIKEQLGVKRPEPRRRTLPRVIENLANTYDARVWLRDERGEVKVHSPPGPPPELRIGFTRQMGAYSVSFVRGGMLLIQIPLDLPGGERGELNFLVSRDDDDRHDGGFLLGLAGVALAFGLLIIPVSRMISMPIRRLRDSAHRIAEGELSHRARVEKKDEIGELGASFNLMADRIERMVQGSRELTAHVSHELRSPLARMRIAEELLRDELAKAQGDPKRQLDRIRSEIHELDDLIGQILTLSRLDLRGPSDPGGVFDVFAVLEELLERYEPSLNKNSLSVELDRAQLQSTEPKIRGEARALRAILDALLDNAIRYGLPGRPIHIRLIENNPPNRLIIEMENRYTPRDTRLPEEPAERLLEPFYRPPGSAQSGSGLGLAIAHKSALALGGDLEVERRGASEGPALIFRIILPLSPQGKRD